MNKPPEEMRLLLATATLHGMLASAPTNSDRASVNERVWVEKAYRFADELLRQAVKG